MPQPTAAGVFGIARTTATSLRLPPLAAASCCSTKPVGTEAATETSNVLAPISGAISCKTSATVCGFTVNRMMSAPFTASRLSVVTAIAKQRSEEHTSELQSRGHLVCRLLLEKKKKKL